MTSPPIPPKFSHRIWTIHRNDLIEQWGGQFPPSPPRGAATDLAGLSCYETDDQQLTCKRKSSRVISSIYGS